MQQSANSFDVWYQQGPLVWSNVHGKLTVTDMGISVVDDQGKKLFELPFTSIKTVHAFLKTFTFHSTNGAYKVSMFDPTKATNKELKAVAAQDVIGGAVGNAVGLSVGTSALNDINSSLDVSVKLQQLLQTKGLVIKGNQASKKPFYVIMAITLAAVIIIVTLLTVLNHKH